jgi:hypothetical protein
MRKRLAFEVLEDRLQPAVFGNPWLNPNITLSFAADGTPVNGVASRFDSALANIPASQRTGEVLRAFQSWIDVANVNVGVVADGGQPVGAAGTAFGDPRFGDVRIAAVPLATENVALGFPFDIAAGTRAGDITFNSGNSFVVGSGAGYDLFSVALHEAGHVFGLPGSSDPTSARYQTADRVRSGPNAADIAAIQALYGARQADSYEGNSGNATIGTAARLQPQNGSDIIAIRADITTAADVDTYSFKADKLNGGAYLATLATSGYSLLHAKIEILDGSGHVLATGAGNTPLRVLGLTEGATYYARITSDDAVFAIGGYKLELRAEATPPPSGDLDDPETGTDDSAAGSSSLSRLPSLGGTRQNFAAHSSLSTATDTDFFRVRANLPSGTSSGPLTASVVATSGLTDPVLEVFDRNLVPVSFRILTHDAGEFTIQVPDTEANRDYYVVVKHGANGTDAAGNYSLGIDFGGPAITLPVLAGGVLTAAAPANLSRIDVPAGQVMHILLSVESAVGAAIRMSIFDASNNTIDSRYASAGDSTSMNVFLAAGTYQFLVGGGSTDAAPMPNLHYTIVGESLSDPVGPQAVAPGSPPVSPPPPPPPATVTPPRPAVPITPSAPNILLVPPTDLPTAPTLQLRPIVPAPAKTIAVGSANIRVLNSDGSLNATIAALANRAGPFRTAEADFNGDGVADVVVGSGPGSASSVVIFDGASQARLFALDPFEAAFTGGVFVAAGDLNGDTVPELIITPDEGGGPRVKILNGVGFTPLRDFFGIDDPNFRGGARAAVGDVNNDGYCDLLVAAGFGGGPRVSGYDGAALVRGALLNTFPDFFAFEETLRNGVYLAAADLNGDGYADLFASGGPGGGPRVLGFDGRARTLGQTKIIANFFGGDVASRDGIRLAVKDLDGDAVPDLVATSGSLVLGYPGVAFEGSLAPPSILELQLGEVAGVLYVG